MGYIVARALDSFVSTIQLIVKNIADFNFGAGIGAYIAFAVLKEAAKLIAPGVQDGHVWLVLFVGLWLYVASNLGKYRKEYRHIENDIIATSNEDSDGYRLGDDGELVKLKRGE